MGMACSRSTPLPCGTPSMMSISTTSASSFDASQCAAVAPTLPEPTTVTFLRMMPHSVRIMCHSMNPKLRDGEQAAGKVEKQIPRGLKPTRDDKNIKFLDADLKVRSTKNSPSPTFSAASKSVPRLNGPLLRYQLRHRRHVLDHVARELAGLDLGCALRSEEHTSEIQSRPYPVC